MKYGLNDKQLADIIAIVKKNPDIESVIIFGSRALGTHKKASDIDIAIKGKNADDFTAIRLKGKLEDETILPYFFDVIYYDSIDNPALKEHIDEHGKIIYDSCK